MSLFDQLRDAAEQTARSVRYAMSQASEEHSQPPYRSVALRRSILQQHRSMSHLRVPASINLTPNTLLLSFMLSRTIKDAGGLARLPKCTQLLLAANCLPFLKPGGVSMLSFGLSPFLVWEHHQGYRLISSAFLHLDLDHLLGNMANLVVSGCYLESRTITPKFAATVLSLTACSQGLFVLLSWMECKWFGAWQTYFTGSAVGFSGVCFALQVVADHLRGGSIMIGSKDWAVPSQFYCWLSLAVNQVLVPQASMTSHLCGILAGLLHVYIPTGIRFLRSRAQQDNDQSRRSGSQSRMRGEILIRDERVQIAGRRIPDVVVHLACFGIALLARNLLSPRSKARY